MDKVVIRFISGANVYNTGDIAGFTPSEAQFYIDEGVAVLYETEDSTEQKPIKRVRNKLEDVTVIKE